jgi:hypothetical protein
VDLPGRDVDPQRAEQVVVGADAEADQLVHRAVPSAAWPSKTHAISWPSRSE